MKDESKASNLNADLKEQFEIEFMMAYANMFMNSVDFKDWNRYCHTLLRAMKSGVVGQKDIRTFALNLSLASVITITPSEHEVYLKNLEVLNKVIDTVNFEQGQARR